MTDVGVTRRACVPALMNQEQRFLRALEGVSNFRMEADTWLILLDDQQAPRLRLIRAEQMSKFDCGQAGAVEIRALQPEVLDGRPRIELSRGGVAVILDQVRTASGARYRGEGYDFWNKGDAARLTVAGNSFECTLLN